MDDAWGFLRRDQSFLGHDPSTNEDSSDGGKSPDLAASMRMVRSYAARVKQLPPSPMPATLGAVPPFPSTFRQLLHRPQPPAESDWRRRRFRKEREPPKAPRKETEPPKAPRAPPERAPRVSNLVFKAAVGLVITKPQARPSSEASRPAPRLPGFMARGGSLPKMAGPPQSLDPPAEGPQCRPLTFRPAGQDPVKKKTRHAILPASRHGNALRDLTSDHFSRRAAPDPDCLNSPLASRRPDELLPAAASSSASSKRFHVRGGARPSSQLMEVFCC